MIKKKNKNPKCICFKIKYLSNDCLIFGYIRFDSQISSPVKTFILFFGPYNFSRAFAATAFATLHSVAANL